MTTQSQYNIFQQLTSVRFSATANLSGVYINGPLNNGVGATLTASSPAALTVDSGSPEIGDRILLSEQTNDNENGIYIVLSSGSASSVWQLQRSGDQQSIEQFVAGQFFSVNAGSTLAGAMYVVVEPLPSHLGVDDLSYSPVAVPSGSAFLVASNNLSDVVSASTSRDNLDLGSSDDVTFNSLTVGNSGLHILDTNATHDLIITPGSNLTADRVFTLTTGDAARTLDISAASVTISAFAATVLDDANAGAVRTTLGAQESANIKSATTANIGGAGAGPISVVVSGLTAASIVVASVETSSNTVSVAKCDATATGFDITFTADPGATCTVNYIAFIAAQ